MAWWRKRDWSADRPHQDAAPSPAPNGAPDAAQHGTGNPELGSTATGVQPAGTGAPGKVSTEVRMTIPAQQDRRAGCDAAGVCLERIGQSLKRLGIRYLTDEDGNLLAMWERHVVLFALEGPEKEILVMRARAYHTLPVDWADRAYTAVNEWNHTRRFLKSYVGDRTDQGRLSLYAEMQLPLVPGVHDALLDEFIDCAAAVSGSWVDWLHDEGALL